MRRVTDPLSAMGAKFVGSTPDLLPIEVRGGPLFALQYRLPVSSAQIKSALLLAGLVGSVEVRLREPNGLSRDHTERLLRALGYTVATEGGWIHFSPDSTPTPLDIAIPGDTSSAAFLVGAAVLADGGALRVEQVGTNPTRIGFIDVLRRMGARIEVENEVDRYGEPVGDLIVVPSDLHGTTVLAGEIPRLIDEIPLLAVLASRAKGTTTFRDVGELRVKESDRLALIAANLRTVGVRAEVNGADLFVEGCDRPPRGRVVTEGDHRIAMAFGVLGTTRRAKIQVDNPSCSDVSFPGFWYALQRMRGRK